MTITERIAQAKAVDYLTVEEVALLLRYAPNTIYRMVKAHRIPGVIRFGRTIRFKKTVTLQWGQARLERRDIAPLV